MICTLRKAYLQKKQKKQKSKLQKKERTYMSWYVVSLKHTIMFCLDDGTPRMYRIKNMADATVSTVYLPAFNHSTTVAAAYDATLSNEGHSGTTKGSSPATTVVT
jgi:hypothetical protein